MQVCAHAHTRTPPAPREDSPHAATRRKLEQRNLPALLWEEPSANTGVVVPLPQLRKG